MKTILVDLGNTALKWAVLGNEHEPHTVVHRGAPESLHDLYEVWQCEAPDAVLGCTVAAPSWPSLPLSFLMPVIFLGNGSILCLHSDVLNGSSGIIICILNYWVQIVGVLL